MRISDWSSDVCSSDLPTREGAFLHDEPADGRIPLLWASDIRANGSFRFQGGTRTANAAWYTPANPEKAPYVRSEEHTSELQSLMRISYAVFCLKKKTKRHVQNTKSE